jgi:hypothetical protein
VQNVYAQSGADESVCARLRLNSVTPISCDKSFQFNVYIFLLSLKPTNYLASKNS